MITNSEKKSRASILTHCIHISPSALLGLLSFLRCSFLFVWPSMDVDVGSTSPPLLFLPLLVVTLQTCIHTYTLPYVSTYDCDAYIDDRHVDEHACAPYKSGTQTSLYAALHSHIDNELRVRVVRQQKVTQELTKARPRQGSDFAPYSASVTGLGNVDNTGSPAHAQQIPEVSRSDPFVWRPCDLWLICVGAMGQCALPIQA